MKFLFAGNCGMGGQEMTQSFADYQRVADGSHQVDSEPLGMRFIMT